MKFLNSFLVQSPPKFFLFTPECSLFSVLCNLYPKASSCVPQHFAAIGYLHNPRAKQDNTTKNNINFKRFSVSSYLP